MGQPAARVGDMHVCPMFDGPKPHVGGPVLPPGKPTVLIGGMPAATITDRCACASVPDIIMQGAQTVLINGMMAARLGDMTVHGGRIVIGCPTVLIGGPTFTDTSLLRFRPPEVQEPTKGEIGTSIVLDLLPVVGTVKGLWEGVTGYDSVTGEKLSTTERLIGWIPVLGKAGRVIKGGGKLLKVADKATKATDAAVDLERAARRQRRLDKIYELREKRAKEFYKKHHPELSDKEIDARVRGIDLGKRVKVRKVDPDENLHRYVRTEDGKILDRGEYYTPNSKATPDELGIGNYYEDKSGQINMRIDKQTGTMSKPVEGLESTAKGIPDDFSVTGSVQQTSGGATQVYIPHTQGQEFVPNR